MRYTQNRWWVQANILPLGLSDPTNQAEGSNPVTFVALHVVCPINVLRRSSCRRAAARLVTGAPPPKSIRLVRFKVQESPSIAVSDLVHDGGVDSDGAKPFGISAHAIERIVASVEEPIL